MKEMMKKRLIEEVLKNKREYLKLRFEKKLGFLKNINAIKEIRRKIAKIMTKINNKVLL